jgi:hypothetical protein
MYAVRNHRVAVGAGGKSLVRRPRTEIASVPTDDDFGQIIESRFGEPAWGGAATQHRQNSRLPRSVPGEPPSLAVAGAATATYLAAHKTSGGRRTTGGAVLGPHRNPGTYFDLEPVPFSRRAAAGRDGGSICSGVGTAALNESFDAISVSIAGGAYTTDSDSSSGYPGVVPRGMGGSATGGDIDALTKSISWIGFNGYDQPESVCRIPPFLPHLNGI